MKMGTLLYMKMLFKKRRLLTSVLHILQNTKKQILRQDIVRKKAEHFYFVRQEGKTMSQNKKTHI